MMADYPLVCGGCGAVLTVDDLDHPTRRPAGHTIPGEIPDLCGPVVRRVCFIDDCGKPATFVALTYPDVTSLCDEHRSLYQPDEWMPAEVVLNRRAVA